MKATFDLPDALIREVKIRAAVQGRTVKDLIAEFLRQGLGIAPIGAATEPPTSPRVDVGEEGMPVVRCRAKAPATTMTVEELLNLEQRTQTMEDLKHAGHSL